MNIEKRLREIRTTILALAAYNYPKYEEFREKEYSGYLAVTLIDELLEEIDMEREAMIAADEA